MITTKENLANNKNTYTKIAREIVLPCKLDIKAGDIYDNKDQIESWTGENCKGLYVNSDVDGYLYCFICSDKVHCYKVDYNNAEEVEFLVADECEDEHLVTPDTKFIITSVSTDEDYKEMGYYEVSLKLAE